MAEINLNTDDVQVVTRYYPDEYVEKCSVCGGRLGHDLTDCLKGVVKRLSALESMLGRTATEDAP